MLRSELEFIAYGPGALVEGDSQRFLGLNLSTSFIR